MVKLLFVTGEHAPASQLLLAFAGARRHVGKSVTFYLPTATRVIAASRIARLGFLMNLVVCLEGEFKYTFKVEGAIFSFLFLKSHKIVVINFPLTCSSLHF